MAAAHPYYPPDAVIAGYRANTWPAAALAGVFAAASAAVAAATLLVVSRARPALGRADRAAVVWFVLSGCIHVVFEGSLVARAGLGGRPVAAADDLLAQLWKEYARADSRYVAADARVLALEALAALVLGPLCLLAAALVARADPRRHALQSAVCVAHAYGAALYFLDEAARAHVHVRPEPRYFWLYYVALNALWIVVPALLLVRCVAAGARAVRVVDRLDAAAAAARKSR